MIRLPKRSVTRFFIPLIDVLTLLFCIFLLMPLVKGSAESDTLASREAEITHLEHELELLRAKGSVTPEELRKKEEELREAKAKVLQEGLAVRVLHIRPTDGKLCYSGERGEVELNEADVTNLINEDRRRLGTSNRELYYLILYPRDRTSIYPLRGDRERYDRWLAGVPHGWDVPGALPAAGGKT